MFEHGRSVLRQVTRQGETTHIFGRGNRLLRKHEINSLRKVRMPIRWRIFQSWHVACIGIDKKNNNFRQKKNNNGQGIRPVINNNKIGQDYQWIAFQAEFLWYVPLTGKPVRLRRLQQQHRPNGCMEAIEVIDRTV